MKTIYQAISRFLSRHYALNIFIFALILLVMGGIIVFSPAHTLEGVSFFCSVYGLMRLITYKNGKIPIFMRDYTWNRMSAEHDEEKAEELYREMSLRHCTVCYMIAVPASVLAIIWEALYIVLFA